MFESFVIGPVGLGPFGLVRRCIECRDRSGGDAATCAGFDAGCLTRSPRDEDRAPRLIPVK